MSRRAAALCSFLLFGCEALTPSDPIALPEVLLDMPIDGDEVAFNTSFSLVGVARAPAGGTLAEAEIVLSSAAYERRTVPLSGEQTELDVELTVARDALLGTDRLPLDIVVAATAVVDGRTVRSEPRGVSLFVVDASAPAVEVTFSPGLVPPAGFDAHFDSGEAFTMNVTAEDPIGGIDAVLIDLPPFAGGPRAERFGGVRRASSTVSIVPPSDIDFEILVSVTDVATSPNVTRRTVRIRIGAGGSDEEPPRVGFAGPATLECGTTSSVAVTATDTGVGVDRIELVTPDGSIELFEPGRADPRTFTATASIDAPRGGGVVPLSAVARDYVGNVSTTTSVDFAVIDSEPPWLANATPTAPTIAPGFTTEIEVLGADSCAEVDYLALALTDGGGRTRTTTVAIGTPSVDATVSVPVPPDLCTLDPIRADVSLYDGGGRGSLPKSATYAPTDLLRPAVRVNTFVPPGGYRPGDIVSVDVSFADDQSGVRSATVTFDAPGLALPSPVFEDARVFIVTGCRHVGSRSIQLSYQIPPDVRFNGPTASIVVTAEAADGVGLTASDTAGVSVVSSAPPLLSFVGPAEGARLIPGALEVVTLSVSDASHDVDTVSLRAVGPATLAPLGTASATVSVQATNATVAFSLTVDPAAAQDAPIELIATAYDTGIPPAFTVARRTLRTCGAPSIVQVVPDIGPISGGTLVTVEGTGFARGLGISVGTTALVGVSVQSSTAAIGMVPAGAYLPQTVDVTVTNDCSTAMPSDVRVGAFRFVAPPSIFFVAPELAQTAQVGDVVPITVAAAGDGVTLMDVAAGVGALAFQPTTLIEDVIDTTIVVPAATATITITGEARDLLGQVAQATRVLTVAAPVARSISLFAPRAVAVGETRGLAVVAEMSNGRRQDLTAQATWSTSSTTAVVGGGTITGAAGGVSTIGASLGALTSSATVEIVQNGIRFGHPPLFLSSASSGAVPVEILRLAGGTSAVTSSITLSSSNPAVLGTLGGSVVAVGSGTATLTATFSPMVTATLLVTVSPTLSVPAGMVVAVPSGQQFTGGTIAGRVLAHRPAVAAGSWTLSSSTLTVAVTGALVASGAHGNLLGPGGRAGAGAGGGGAGLAAGGATGGFGEPAGGSTANDLPATLAGDGGGVSGGQGARAAPDTTGAGGGSAGAGGNAPLALGGAPSLVPGGGGGGRGGGGGGGGAVVQLTLGSVLTLDGTIDVSGGVGAAMAGGGGGGTITIAAARVAGLGRLRAPGGAASAEGGGGRIDLSSVAQRPTRLFVDVVGAFLGAVTR